MKKTTNYKMFSCLKGNRSIDKGQVKKLIQSISTNNLLEYNPIMVTKRGLVIDGQHRLEAARSLNLPVFYNEVSGNLTEVILLNSNAKNWSIDDFVNSHIELGNDEYVALKQFKEKWGVAYTTAASLLMAKKVGSDLDKISDPLKEGSFKVLSLKRANEVMEWTSSFSDYADKVIMKNRSFIKAVETLLDTDEITLSGLNRKLEIANRKLVRSSTRMDYLRQIEEIVNFKSRTKVRLY